MARPVLLTRPAGQISATAKLLREHGLPVIEMPLTGISGPARTPTRSLQQFAAQADWLIFTSRNAVQLAAPWLTADPARRVVAIGEATARAARAAGWEVRWAPAGRSSEALLGEPGAPKLGGKICIVGGSGGRRWLKVALEQRGCEVRKLIVYRRIGLDPGAQAVREAIAAGPLLVFSSGHGLRQWQRLCSRYEQAAGLKLPLLVASRRLCKLAGSLGYAEPAQALPQMSDAALLTALTKPNR